MDPVRKALKETLEDDNSLMLMAEGGVHYRLAPPDSRDQAHVIFQKMSGTRMYTFADEPMRNQVWLVKGVGPAAVAEDMNDRCLAVLAEELSVDNYAVLLQPMAEDDVSYAEVADGEVIQHEGTNYRVVVELQ